MGLIVTVGDHFKTVIHHYDQKAIELIAYVCETEYCEIKLVDHDKIEWIEVPDLLKWNLAPADIPIAEALIEEHKLSQ